MKKPLFFNDHLEYRPLEEVLEVLKKPLISHAFSVHFQSKEVSLRIEHEWSEILRLLGASVASDVFIMGSLQEALCKMARLHYNNKIFSEGKAHVMSLSCDQRWKKCWEDYKEQGVISQTLEVDTRGLITKEDLEQMLHPRVSLLSITWAHPITGIIQPLEMISKVCKEKGVALHVDISHAVGKLYFSLRDLPCDYITLDAKAFGGPYHMALLIEKNGRSQKEWLGVPQHLEALRIALYHALERLDSYHLEIARLKQQFEKKLLQKIPEAKILYKDVEKLPHISVIEFPKVMNELFLYFLAENSLFASLGDPSIFILPKQALSFSFSEKMRQEELDEAIETITSLYKKGQRLSKGLE